MKTFLTKYTQRKNVGRNDTDKTNVQHELFQRKYTCGIYLLQCDNIYTFVTICDCFRETFVVVDDANIFTARIYF